MRCARAVTLALFGLIVVGCVPSTAAQAPWIIVDDPPNDAAFLDLLHVNAELPDAGHVRLEAVLAPYLQPFVESVPYVAAADFRARVYFELATPEASEGSDVATVRLTALKAPHESSGQWRLTMDVMEGRLSRAADDVSDAANLDWTAVPVAGDSGGSSIAWTIDRVALATLFPQRLPLHEPWTLSRPFAATRIDEPVSSGSFAWALGVDPSESWERAPDDGFGRSITLPPLQEGPAADRGQPEKVDNAAPQDAGREYPVKFLGGSSAPDFLSGSTMIGIAVPALAAVFAGLMRYAWPTVFALFSRIDRQRALDHPRREALYEALGTNPGATFTGLREILGYGSGPLAHHLAVLEKNGLVRHRDAFGRRLYYRGGDAPPTIDQASSRARLAGFVRGTPGLDASSLSAKAGLSRTTVLYHMQRLESENVVRSENARGIRRFFPV